MFPFPFQFENILPNAEWKLVKLDRGRHVTRYECCPEPYVDLTFNVTIERRSPAYKAMIVTPATGELLKYMISCFDIPNYTMTYKIQF